MFSRGRVDEEARQLRHVVVAELADGAEVDEPDRARLLQHEDVRRVRVAVEEPVPEDHRHPRLGDEVRELAPLFERQRSRVDVPDLRALEPLERQHARARVRPVDLRHVHVRIAGEVAVEALGVPRLEPVVELVPELARELVDERLRVDEVERADALLHEPRRLVEQGEIGLDLARRARPLHLDRDLLPVRKRRAIDLADRRRRDGLRVELEEQPLERVAELLLDHALRLLERERAHVVLERAQLGDDVGRHDVRARREQLAELDERRPELVEQLAQVLAAGRDDAAGGGRGEARLRRAARQQVGELVRLEEVAEAVPHHHLRDLRQAAQASRGWLRHHTSVPAEALRASAGSSLCSAERSPAKPASSRPQ